MIPLHDLYQSEEGSEEEASDRAELERAKEVAKERMDCCAAVERAQTFAVLNNVPEKNSPPWLAQKQSKFLQPSLILHSKHTLNMRF